MEEKYVLALDVGTTGLRAIIYDHDLKEIGKAYRETPIIIPNPGWVEQDPEMIWTKTQEVIREVLGKVPPEKIAALGITNQRGAFTMWDPKTGKPRINIIGWQDIRTAEECVKITKIPKYRLIRGLMRFLYLFKKDPFFYAASKIEVTPVHATIRTKWILDNVPSVTREMAKKREVIWGTIDTWLIWKLTEGRVHASDPSNLATSAFLSPFGLKWLTLYTDNMKLPLQMLPTIVPTNGDFGETTLFGGHIPIRAAVGDQQASLFGQCCFERGDTKCTNGTGTFVNMNTGDTPFASPHGIIPIVAWQLCDAAKTTRFMLEGQDATCGELIDWLIDGIGLISKPSEVDELAITVPNSNNVYMVPAFTGLRFPYWDPYARGTLVGLARDTNKAHIMRAVLEGIGFRVQDFLSVMSSDMKIPVKRLRCDGGVAKSDYLLQFIADITGATVERGPSTDTTAIGAAMLAGLGIGYWKDMDELKKARKVAREFTPRMESSEKEEKLARWQKAIVSAKGWAIDIRSSRAPKK